MDIGFNFIAHSKLRLVLIIVFLICFVSLVDKTFGKESNKLMISHPERYIKVTDWSLYSVWSSVAIIHHVTIENTSDIAYEKIKVRICYYSTSTSKSGTLIAQETGFLPVTLPPRSKKTYLSGGAPFGTGAMAMDSGNLVVLGASPIIN